MNPRMIVVMMLVGAVMMGGCEKKTTPPPAPPAAPQAAPKAAEPNKVTMTMPAAKEAVVTTADKTAKVAVDAAKAATDTAKAAVDSAKTAAVAAVTPAEQTMCPVMTKQPIDKSIFVEYKGKKVYFCCTDCKAAFEKEPEKYVANLPQFK
jgi:YHS domain-containing protein